MIEDIKNKVLEFAAIANECPETLREKCFELLLSYYLDSVYGKKAKKEKPISDGEQKEDNEKGFSLGGKRDQDDIEEKDIHVKARQFLKRYSLSIDNINELYYKEDGHFKPLYDDLNTTQAKESQIRISLLQALQSSLENGDYEFDGENVRTECQARKCYDMKNFTNYFNQSKELFDAFEKYSKEESKIKLSTSGKEKLANLIKELQ